MLTCFIFSIMQTVAAEVRSEKHDETVLHPVRVAFKIWVQLGSSNASLGFFSALKLAVSAAGFQSVTVQVRLDTVEVRGSSPLVPTIFSITYKTLPKNLGPFGSDKRLVPRIAATEKCRASEQSQCSAGLLDQCGSALR